MRQALKLFILLPVLTLIWGMANSIGVTTAFSELTGLPDMNKWQIPGLAKLVEFRETTGDVTGEVKEKARRMAIKAVKAEVSRRYGPEAAALIPNDMTRQEAKNFDFKQFEKLLEKKLPEALPTNKPTPKPTKTPKPSPTPTEEPTKAPGGSAYVKALAKLDTLAVKGKAPMTGYDRDEFGSEWDDSVGTFSYSRNGCDTRNDLLKRDLVNVKFDSGSDCDVVSGTLPYEPYTGAKNYYFDSEDDEYATDLDAEHIVALGNVWVTGGFQWTEAKRALIANDPINLMMADPSSNRQKGDADFATWLPSNKSYRCTYAVQQVKVKSKYDLWVTTAEKSALTGVLSGCR